MKMDGLKTIVSFWDCLFSGAMLVLGSLSPSIQQVHCHPRDHFWPRGRSTLWASKSRAPKDFCEPKVLQGSLTKRIETIINHTKYIYIYIHTPNEKHRKIQGRIGISNFSLIFCWLKRGFCKAVKGLVYDNHSSAPLCVFVLNWITTSTMSGSGSSWITVCQRATPRYCYP